MFADIADNKNGKYDKESDIKEALAKSFTKLSMKGQIRLLQSILTGRAIKDFMRLKIID